MKTYSKVILGVILIIIVFGLIYIFSDKTPSIKVLSPVSGDSVVVGSVQKIKWSTKNIPSNYKVSVAIRRIPPPALKEEGQEFDPLVFTDLPNTGSTDWTVSDMYPAGNYVVELTAYAGVPVTNPVSAESGIFSIKNSEIVGGDRDVNGCLISAGYSFNQSVGACIRAFEMTPDIMKASKLAVDSVGSSYALTVASFNSYEEAGAYDIFLEQGVDRVKRTIYIKNWKVVSDPLLTCHESSKYFVLEKSLAPNVGSDILVKNKTAPTQVVPCEYRVGAGDFEIKNADAQYFLAFTDNFMLIDQGTAPEPRGLIIYDLRTQKQVFMDSYAKPVDVVGDSITYLSKTNIKPTTQNCPDLKTYTENGLGAVIMSRVTLNLLTLSKKDLGQPQCRATQ